MHLGIRSPHYVWSPSGLILGELRLAIGQISLCIPDLSSSMTAKNRPWLAQLGRTQDAENGEDDQCCNCPWCDWVPLESRQCWLKFELVDRHYSNRKPLFLPQNPGKSHVSVRIQTKRAWLKTSWFTPWTAARHEKHFGWDLVTQMLQPLSVLCVLFVFVSCLVDVVFSWNMQSSTWNAFFVVFDFHLTDRSPYVMECTAWARR